MPWHWLQAKTAQLQQGMKMLDDRIRAEVQLRQHDLLLQAENLQEAQNLMQVRTLPLAIPLPST